MATEWHKTDFKGVRYRKHATRKHGVGFDRYYVLTYKWRGKTHTEAVGWASEGNKPSDAFAILGELKRNQTTGTGPCTLTEMRQKSESQKRETEKIKVAEEKVNVSFKSFFEDIYFPEVKTRWKPDTATHAETHVRLWIDPVCGNTPMRDLGLDHINRIKSRLSEEGRMPRTQQYVFRTFAMVWNAALDYGIVEKRCPTKSSSFRLPKIDNEKQRYLTPEEESKLFTELFKRSRQTYDMALVSIDSGLRFGEIAALTWGCVDTEKHNIRVMNTKSKKDRIVPMTGRLVSMFEAMTLGEPNALVFPTREGTRIQEPQATFKRALKASGLNDGVSDPKMVASFHSLRHTFASRLVQAGVDLFRVQRLLGHSTPVMTARYAKLADDDLRNAIGKMEFRQNNTGAEVIPFKKVK